MEGYGLYWYCLELIAAEIDRNHLTFELEHDAEVIGHDTGIHYERVQEIMTYMVNIGLFENSNGIITCMKLAKRIDQSMTSDTEFRKKIRQIHESHDGVMTESGQNQEMSCKKIEGRSQKAEAKKTNNTNPGDVDETVWDDFVALRKTKKAPITDTAMKTIRREAEKAGYTITEALRECCSRGWAGFKSDWVKEKGNGTHQQSRKLSASERATEARKEWERNNPDK